MSTSISTPTFTTFVELLQWRAEQQPDQRLYSFLADGELEKDYLTFAELDRQARIIGATLQEYEKSGERALLIYPSGLEFIAAFFGCLYSGIIAVPVYPPSTVRIDRTLERLRAIARDAQPSVVLTPSSLSSKIEGLLTQTPELQQARLLVTDRITGGMEESWKNSAINSGTLAFLQYTSGSTGMPKGVMVTHGNLLHNSSLIAHACKHPPEAHVVSWLPMYHDLGLIGGILQPLYAGCGSTIMSPTAFLQRPIRWLQAISRTKATLSGGPNFGYDLCARKITSEQKAELDLSSWRVAANGAEPVRAETLERFAATFESCGFRRSAFYPSYGLAETTLLVSCGHLGNEAFIKRFEGEALEQHLVRDVSVENKEKKSVRTLVGIGEPLPDQHVVIVDPESFTPCLPGRVGEIWVSGHSVAQGYWRHPEETEYSFHARLAEGGEGLFLRTGDLGFLYEGNLFITGRLKDLIIIRGSNYYPQDIELSVERSHPALRPNSGVAFSVDVDDEERLVIVQEVERQYLRADMSEIISAIRQAVAEQYDLQVYAVTLIKPGSIPKTSSGKVQRRSTKSAFLDGSLDIINAWSLGSDGEYLSPRPRFIEPDVKVSLSPTKTKEEIQNWLITQISERLRVDLDKVDIREPFAYYGMDSVQAVSLSADLETWLGLEFSPTVAYDYPTIEALARYLAHGRDESGPSMESSQVHEPAKTADDGIAIIGIGCRFPAAQNPEHFWQLLRDGVDGISEVPVDRWNLQDFYESEKVTPGKMNTRWGGFLEQVDQFDPYFFGISPREASRMDPQQRLLLEVAWEALEHAGLAPEKRAGTQTGVFVGISSDDYSRLQYNDLMSIDAYAGTGNAHSIAANRLSYQLDLRGPSMAIDTACSSSLVAVHMACQSLRNGECDVALAGGVNVILSPELTITLSQAHMLSSDGRCKTFDDAADGYVRSEGCGIVVLKSLSKAQRDGDNILAIIRGSAVNQDGRSNGLTAPNGPSQEAVIRQALRNARVMPEQISYVETHGSSTPLGDPIEVDSLKAVLMPRRSPEQTCLLGSVKTNIGHLESAAGIAGLIKVVLSLHKGEIPPHLHFKKLNQHISLDGTPFQIPTQRQQWPTSKRRLAGVSAFGFGGTNVHVVVEEASASNSVASEVERPLHLLTLSAQSETALQSLTKDYAAFLAERSDAHIADICFTANTGRSHFSHRLAVTANTSTQLQERLHAFAVGRVMQDVQRGRVQGKTHPKVAFLFTGQGSQYFGMGRQLYDTQPTFRQVLDRCDQILRPSLGQSLLSVLYPEAGVSSPLHETAYTQPALFALEYALAELWNSWGVKPDVVMGHSVGEYVAACIAGVFSLEDGLRLVAERGHLMQALSQHGEMAVVFADQNQLAAALAPFQKQVAIAVMNGPKNTVISGESKAIREILRNLEAEGLTTYPMAVSHAFHSPLMDPMLDAFEQAASQLRFGALRLPLISNLTGKMLDAGETLNAHYWRRQTREAVQFAAGMYTLAERGYEVFLEVGPTPTMLNMGQRCIQQSTGTWMPSLHKNQDNWETLFASLRSLYAKGVDIDWCGVDRDYVRHRLPLPTYPFERERCWFNIQTANEVRSSSAQVVSKEGFETERREQKPTPETPHPVPASTQGQQRHPLLNSYVELVYPSGVHVWETALNKQQLSYLNDHRIQGVMALPVSAYIEMAQAATIEALGPGSHVLTEIELKKLLLLPEQGSQKVQIVLFSDTNKHVIFQVYSHARGMPEQPRSMWTLHATGKILHN